MKDKKKKKAEAPAAPQVGGPVQAFRNPHDVLIHVDLRTVDKVGENLLVWPEGSILWVSGVDILVKVSPETMVKIIADATGKTVPLERAEENKGGGGAPADKKDAGDPMTTIGGAVST